LSEILIEDITASIAGLLSIWIRSAIFGSTHTVLAVYLNATGTLVMSIVDFHGSVVLNLVIVALPLGNESE